MLLSDKYDYVSKVNMTEGIVIYKNKDGYIFEKNDIEIKSQEEIIDVLKKLKNKVPNYYSELIKFPSLKELSSKIETQQMKKGE